MSFSLGQTHGSVHILGSPLLSGLIEPFPWGDWGSKPRLREQGGPRAGWYRHRAAGGAGPRVTGITCTKAHPSSLVHPTVHTTPMPMSP